MLRVLKHWVERIWWGFLAYSIAIKYVFYEFFGRMTGRFSGFQGREFPRNDGRYAVVTGGSRGIGLQIVENLLKTGYSIVIGSSSSADMRKKLEEELKKNHPGSCVEVWYLDLSSQKSVKVFAEKYDSSGRPLHLLINNAGIMFVEEEITEDGLEKHFAVNYLSHCLLTLLLLPLLSDSGAKERKSRIINCTSCIHYMGNMEIGNLNKREYYSKYKAYIESKLAQVMFTYSLQSFLQSENFNITVNCVHPGVVDTELMSSVLWFPRMGSLLFKSPEEGAETATFAALSPEMEGIGGKYLEECVEVISSKISQDTEVQNELWATTFSLLKPWLESDNVYLNSLK